MVTPLFSIPGRISFLPVLCLCLLLALSRPLAAQQAINIIPKPVQCTFTGGQGKLLKSGTAIYYNHAALSGEAGLLQTYLANSSLTASLQKGAAQQPYSIQLDIDSIHILHEEGYTLTIHDNTVFIKGKSGKGVFYGIQSLVQLVEQAGPGDTLLLPKLTITDAPRFAWRGMHLDVCRHFFGVDFVKKYIDLIALHKMNTFHWHLTDDQGWRIEIKKYPLLTQIGSMRAGSMVGHYSDQRIDSIRYGGFYTQQEIREIVAYAAARHITVVPEIEMPGHALAALTAYPHLSCTGGPFKVERTWGVFDDVFCAGNDSTFAFIQDVLDEVCDLFPGQFIHIGGDECPKTRWKTCAKCQARIKQENVTDEHGLQSYFIRRIEKHVNAKGRQIIGWDEILEGGLAPNAAVMSWRGTEGGTAAAKQKHYAVMSPGSHCYFDHYQSMDNEEPISIGGHTPVEKVYAYEPVPEGLNAEEAKYIMGAQANVWTEYITTPEHVQYMVLPRMSALAEVLWTPKHSRSLEDFYSRSVVLVNNLTQQGYTCNTRYMSPQPEIVKTSPEQVGFRIQKPKSPAGKNTYTTIIGVLSGFETTFICADSCTCIVPYTPSGTTHVAMHYTDTLVPFNSMPATTGIRFTKSFMKKITYITPPKAVNGQDTSFVLLNGYRGPQRDLSQNFIGWEGQNMELVIDLQKKTKTQKVTIGYATGEYKKAYAPAKVMVYASNDRKRWKKLTQDEGNNLSQDLKAYESLYRKTRARYIKVVAENIKTIPRGKYAAGENAWLYIDEIFID